jgi:hypothetical protein
VVVGVDASALCWIKVDRHRNGEFFIHRLFHNRLQQQRGHHMANHHRYPAGDLSAGAVWVIPAEPRAATNAA